MTNYEKIIKSMDTLANYLSSDNKGDNTGCSECEYLERCKGKETCKNAWLNWLKEEYVAE